MSKGNQPRWSSTGVKDGIESITIQRRYSNFIDYVYKNFNDSEDFIFRGHRRDTYKLESTIDRRILDKTRTHEIRQKQLKCFKIAAIGKRGPYPIEYSDDKDWWALGQHNGLDTPLLDWTYSPFVASYFAFYKKDEALKRRVVFALNKTEIQKRLQGQNDLDVDFFQPTTDGNARILSQNGLFTFSKSGTELEDWVRAVFKSESEKRILIKFFIPNSERVACLKILETMNINHLTLFPDIYGASKYSNTKLLSYE